MKHHELTPTTQKSFYGRAVVYTREDGARVLYSDLRAVCSYHNGRFIKYGVRFSPLELKHVNAFRAENGLAPVTRKAWAAWPCFTFGASAFDAGKPFTVAPGYF